MQSQRADPKQKVDAYFETSTEYWKRVYSDDGLLPRIYQDRHNTALGLIWKLGLPKCARILEVGCGAGLISVALARNGYTVHAMDSTTAMLQMAWKETVDRGVQDAIRLSTADAHTLPFGAQTFDLVIAIGVVPWLHSERVALHEMHRVLKPRGHLLMTADNNARLNRILDPLSCPVLTPLRASAKRLLQLCGYWAPDPGFRPKRHYPHEVNRLLHTCNFKKLKACTVGFGPYTLFGRELFADRIGVALHRRFQMLASIKDWSAMRWAGSHYLVLAAKA
jgi:2-polyprenyl-3-methyl-5-hydroxy-6-metoxy-1,4-benzoquinol methylase